MSSGLAATIALVRDQGTTVSGQSESTLLAIMELMEVELGCFGGYSIVERRMVDALMAEQGITASPLSGDMDTLSMGRLIKADYVLIVGIEQHHQQTLIHVRVVESVTGVIKGVGSVGIRDRTADSVAEELAQITHQSIRTGGNMAATIAVAPFNAQAGFMRSRFLEEALPGLLTSELINLGGLRVLQRSSMQQLLEEIEWMYGGFMAGIDPAVLPSRQSTLILAGDFREKNQDNMVMIEVQTTLRDADGRVVHEGLYLGPMTNLFPLVGQVSREISLVARKFVGADVHEVARRSDQGEEARLMNEVMNALARLEMVNPVTRGRYRFEYPGETMFNRAVAVAAIPPGALNDHVVRVSVNRLEQILFVNPNHTGAMYLLGCVLGLDVKRGQQDRAMELLTQVIRLDPESAFATLAAQALARVNFDASGELVSGREAQAARAYEMAGAHLANNPDLREAGRYPTYAITYYEKVGDLASIRRLLRGMAHDINTKGSAWNSARMEASWNVAKSMIRFAMMQEAYASDMLADLQACMASTDPYAVHFGQLGMAFYHESKGAMADAAEWYVKAARSLEGQDGGSEVQRREWVLLSAAQLQLESGDPAGAITILKSMQVVPRNSDNNYAKRSLLMGQALEQVGRKDDAVSSYMDGLKRHASSNYKSTLMDHVQELGGVRSEHAGVIRVREILDKNGLSIPATMLVAGDGVIWGTIRKKQVGMFDPATDEWRTFNKTFTDWIWDLEYDEKTLWVGLKSGGLWSYDPLLDQWKHWSVSNGLPSDRIMVMAASKGRLYALVGEPGACGVVEVSRSGDVRILDAMNAPKDVMRSIVVDEPYIWFKTELSRGAYRLHSVSGEWTYFNKAPVGNLFGGPSGVWISARRRELAPFALADRHQENPQDYAAVWTKEPEDPYLVRFVVEDGSYVWFGGTPVVQMVDGGLHRFDRATGAYIRFGVDHGMPFQFASDGVDDAVLMNGSLWITRCYANGLYEVAPVVPAK
ncbi:MAG TPA: hypothetical protein PKC67_05130 [Kiritimatiellia bacterium]|nr:hypothetical protein [Kiritimatiellia bacterium]HMP33716.1 hypothetical protein [Kiritimatiellia bacterium]